jgi:SH3-like domain-containing protein
MALRNLLVFGLLCAVMAMSSAWAQEWVSIRNDNVNMRTGPNTTSPVQFKLAKGYPLQVMQRRNNWLQVRDFEDDRGWVLKSLTGNAPHHVVSNATANIRSGPGTQHTLVATAKRGELLRTLEKRGDWVRIERATGQAGWISKPLLWGW